MLPSPSSLAAPLKLSMYSCWLAASTWKNVGLSVKAQMPHSKHLHWSRLNWKLWKRAKAEIRVKVSNTNSWHIFFLLFLSHTGFKAHLAEHSILIPVFKTWYVAYYKCWQKIQVPINIISLAVFGNWCAREKMLTIKIRWKPIKKGSSLLKVKSSHSRSAAHLWIQNHMKIYWNSRGAATHFPPPLVATASRFWAVSSLCKLWSIFASILISSNHWLLMINY